MSTSHPINGGRPSADHLRQNSIFDSDSPIEDEWHHDGDYATRLEEVLSESEDSDTGASRVRAAFGDDDDDDGDAFVYDGKDAEPAGTYRDQLREVLEEDMGSYDEYLEEAEVDKSLQVVSGSVIGSDVGQLDMSTSSRTRSESFASELSSARLEGHGDEQTVFTKQTNSFLHPSISRLRSTLGYSTNFGTETPSNDTLSPSKGDVSPSPSRLTAASHTSSSNLNLHGSQTQTQSRGQYLEPFRWTSLQVVNEFVYFKQHGKASAILGSPTPGSPTTLAANSLICIGTDAGKVWVFDFKQNLLCICGQEQSNNFYGAVTALALSHDHTFVATGHVYGHIQLFDLKRPQTAARTVNPTTLSAVASGRQEGHLYGSRITAIGFIAARHTAIVSADNQGLAFYHSLGKVLFVDAVDVIRIMGKYPEEELLPPSIPDRQPEQHGASTNGSTTPRQHAPTRPSVPRLRGDRKLSNIVDLSPLPLGPASNATDAYQVVAMLTPSKLVIVGLRPSAKTWFRRHRDDDDDAQSRSRQLGCLAWFPSVALPDVSNGDEKKRKKSKKDKEAIPSAPPLLAYTWGSSVTIVRVSETKVNQKVRDEKTGQIKLVQIGKLSFAQQASVWFQDRVLAMQWLNANQLVVLTESAIEVYDSKTLSCIESSPFNSLDLISPTLGNTHSGSVAYHDSRRDISHSIRIYKGKVFALGYDQIRVGTLLTWADRILSYVQAGDFLSAIDLTRDYYLGTARGNKNGLPEDPDALRQLVGSKLRDLMKASARYAFSPDRLTDSTHVTPDNRGVDRTDLFEELVRCCARSCISLDDFDFLYEELFQWYEENQITPIFLRQIEEFVLDSAIHYVPPRITQRLIAMHEEDGKLDRAERIIWHIDPDCLDINQAIRLCQSHGLYDALIYVYNTALGDYKSPLVEFLTLIREIVRQRKMRRGSTNHLDTQMIRNAYKIFPYLTNILCGQTYPSEAPMATEDALQAQHDVYSFLFYGRSSVWPADGGGKLVLTADEDGGTEPTYPYARILLRFDAEAFLHTLDIAFENSYLNDATHGISRQIVVMVLLEIISTPSTSTLSLADASFVNIFISRNVPKYPQFLHLSPTALQGILENLAKDTDQSTREDRQLAVEFLLSVFTPRDSNLILQLFEEAGFFRILRMWYKQERQWPQLIQTFLQDADVQADDLFKNIEDVLKRATPGESKDLPVELANIVMEATPRLLQTSILQTALMVDKFIPACHAEVLKAFSEDDEYKRYIYLRCLMGPAYPSDDTGHTLKQSSPSQHVDVALRTSYLDLLCRYDAEHAVHALKHLPKGYIDVHAAIKICEGARVFDGVVWLLNEEDGAVTSLEKVKTYTASLAAEIAEQVLNVEGAASPNLESCLSTLGAMSKMATSICLQQSQNLSSSAEVPLEDLWFSLLDSHLNAVQSVSTVIWNSRPADSNDQSPQQELIMSSLRSLVQDAFAALVTVSSTKAVSFPRLFKRLVDPALHRHKSVGMPYTEFRTILSSMLDSYRFEQDLLAINKKVIGRDLFDALEGLTIARQKGWTPSSSRCPICKKSIHLSLSRPEEQKGNPVSFVVARTGLVYHRDCHSLLNNSQTHL